MNVLTFIAYLLGVSSLVLIGCTETRRVLVEQFSGTYEATDELPLPPPIFDGKDASREQIAVNLTPVAWGLDRPTDIQFDPSRPSTMIVLEQTGAVKWFDIDEQTRGVVQRYSVPTVSEQGLLGMAFHPHFPDSPMVYLNLTHEGDGTDYSRILEVRFEPPADLRESRIRSERVILDLEQPYQNHNAGQLQFGPDGYLYIGWGDGGWAGDVHDHGQNPSTMLGSMLRIDVRPSETTAYTIPDDNPFLDEPNTIPEIWAIGLRNPWRYCFDPAGRLIVADVGQNKWEEITIVEAGKNYGWRLREGRHCYDPPQDCEKEGLVDPIYEYDHDEGQSITGGYVYTADDFDALKGLYLFGDFVTGRLWALPLPTSSFPSPEMPEPYSLGRWEMLISSFGQDADGKVYLAEFGHGIIYRIDNPTVN